MSQTKNDKSSSEFPNDPPTTPSGANDKTHGTPTDSVRAGFEADLKNFFNNHLLRAPLNALHHLTQANIHAKLAYLKQADAIERPIYALLASLLTTMSKALYKTLNKHEKTALRKRHRVPPGKPGHLTFVDHHTTAPTQFPHKARGDKVNDKPALLGVYNVADFEPDPNPIPILDHQCHQVYKGIPYHRIEAIVEIIPLDGGCGGREKLVTYACHHHQARPDRPGVYGLVAKPEWYQVIYSDPSGVVASPETSWDNLELLAAYVYSHYCPPPGHFLWDDTIQWAVGTTISDMPTWKVKVQTQWYTNGALVFLGDPQRRRTTILRAISEDGQQVIIKEMYRQDRLFKEENILEHIHHDGEVLGVVRMQGWEEVENGGEVIQCIRENKKQTKVRLALLDSGVSLFHARSVNDLLKAIYDALEVHRTMYNERRVIHRDMSFYNILMYPQWGNISCTVPKKVPVFIEDILRGSKPTKHRFPTCLVIDFDHAAQLGAKGDADAPKERVGTPMFIARSVSLGRVLKKITGKTMPLLHQDALDLYKATHGERRYGRYSDNVKRDAGIKVKVGIQGKLWIKGMTGITGKVRIRGKAATKVKIAGKVGIRGKGKFAAKVGTRGKAAAKVKIRAQDQIKTIHGGIPPAQDPRDCAPEQLPAFKHRAEHDVESIYWTMVYTLLCVHPRDTPRETDLSDSSRVVWDILLSHHIPKPNCDVGNEKRGLILDRNLPEWQALFCDKMKDVAILLNDISKHIIPEYALWEDKLHPDHLHEALQRLILQYLVDHRDNDIPLDPRYLRHPWVSVPDMETKTNPEYIPANTAADTAGAEGDVGDDHGQRVTTGGTVIADESRNPSPIPTRTSSKRKSDDSDKQSDSVRTSKRRKTSRERDHMGVRVASGQTDAMHAVIVGASSAARDQAAIPVRTSSKRKSDDFDKPVPEGLRRSKRRKATDDSGYGSDVGRGVGKGRKGGSIAQGATSHRKDTSGGGAGSAAANRRSGAPSACSAESSVPSRTTRSKRRTADSDRSSEGVRSSLRLKDAAVKKQLEASKKEVELKGGRKKAVTTKSKFRRT